MSTPNVKTADNKGETIESKNNFKQKSRGRGRRRPQKREDEEFQQKIVDIARVTRITEGGKQMSFRATVAVGDGVNRVGVGIGKGLDVSIAVNKAVNQAKKKLIKVPVTKDGTIPHERRIKYGSAKILLKPAPHGTGIIAGGVMRIVLELSGLKNVTAKMIGSTNKLNNAMATVEALKNMKLRS